MSKEECVAYGTFAARLKQVCLQYNRQFGGDLHDYQSAADDCFFRAQESYNETKGCFEAYLLIAIRNSLIQVGRKRHTRWWQSQLTGLQDCWNALPQRSEMFDVGRFAFELSEDAAVLITDLLTNVVPQDRQYSFDGVKLEHQRVVLRQRARARGWENQRVMRAFREIESALEGAS